MSSFLPLQNLLNNGEYKLVVQKSKKLLDRLVKDTWNGTSVLSKQVLEKQQVLIKQARCYALLKVGRIEEALIELDVLLSLPLESIFSKDKKVEILYYKAYAQYQLYRLEDALETCHLVAELSEKVFFLQAQVLFRLARYEEANNVFAALVQTNPTIELLCNTAATKLLAGKLQEALSICQNSQDCYEMLFVESCACCEIGDLQRAQEAISSAISICTNLVTQEQASEEELTPLETQLAYIYQLNGKESDAEKLYRKTLCRHTNDWNAYSTAVINLVALRGYNQLHDSLKLLKSVMAKKNRSKLTPKQQISLVVNHILILLQVGNFEVCKSEIDNLMNLSEYWKLGVLLRCCLFSRQRQWKEAMIFLEELQQTYSDKSLEWDALKIQLCLERKDIRDGLEHLSKSKSFEGYPGTACTIALLQSVLGNTESAIQVLLNLLGEYQRQRNYSVCNKLIRMMASLTRKKNLHMQFKNILEDYLKENPSQMEAVAENVIAYCHIDLDSAIEWSKQLPSLPNESIMSFDELESSSLLLTHSSRWKKQRMNVLNNRPQGLENLNKKKKKRRHRGKKPFPKHYRADFPPPDPEKWLPKSLRSSHKKKKKSSRHQEAAKMQGADASKVNGMEMQSASGMVDNTGVDRLKGSRRRVPRKKR
eukprot:jgi/Galph1/1367/GphlegSOOS_G5934.1